jgi:periplasmic divalent cation tolerance protein
MTECIQVFTTTSTESDARKIATALVKQRLAACVQVLGPLASTYHWQGKIESNEEWLCLIKSTTELYPELEATIRELHPYEVPEILAVPVLTGCQDYLDWLKTELKQKA